MGKYRAKAVVDAEQWVGREEYTDAEARPAPPPGCLWKQRADDLTWYLVHETVDGVERVHSGDWLIKNAVGQTVPMRDEVFRYLYEPVDIHAEPTPKVTLSGCVAPGTEHGTLPRPT